MGKRVCVCMSGNDWKSVYVCMCVCVTMRVCVCENARVSVRGGSDRASVCLELVRDARRYVDVDSVDVVLVSNVMFVCLHTR